MKGVNPEWAKLPKRACDYCGKRYQPKQPLQMDERGNLKKGFCSVPCRKAYHKHGGAYIKLRGEMIKMVERFMREFRAEIRKELLDARLESAAIYQTQSTPARSSSPSHP